MQEEEADDISPGVIEELGRILFERKTVAERGKQRKYVATDKETVSIVKKLLQRRRRYMDANNLQGPPLAPGGASQPARGRYPFTNEDRKRVMGQRKDEFHSSAQQLQQQWRGSWKPLSRPTTPQQFSE